MIAANDVVLADQLLLEPRTAVLSIWSWPFRLNQEVTGEVISYVERRLHVGRKPYMSIWGETRTTSQGICIWVFYPILEYSPSSAHPFTRSWERQDGGIPLSTHIASGPRVACQPGSSPKQATAWQRARQITIALGRWP